MMRVGLATKNLGKVREICAIVAEAGVDVVSPPEDWIAPEETEPDYEGNALLKARALAAVMGIPCMADDSGIEVDGLDGGPGHLSARYAGEGATDLENLTKVIDAIRDVPPARRTARYRCVAVLVDAGVPDVVVEETVEGTLITAPRGSGGFGYDPIFVPLGDTRTMAELTPQEKDAISHRGKAFRALIPALRARAVAG